MKTLKSERLTLKMIEPDEIEEIVAITTSDNDGSRALLSKLGFTYVKVQEALSDTVELLLYQMSLGESNYGDFRDSSWRVAD
ncbi:hypothetical protein NM22_00310 [Vibrio tubiashii]|nr:hypothetical protein NM22_00310 [Vibrio tubiashii]